MGGCNSSSNQVESYESTDNPRSSIGKTDIEKFRQETLKYHNNYRKMHRAPPLTNDPGLEQSAQVYAEKMAKSGNFAHSSATERNGAGENLFASSYTINQIDANILAQLSKEASDCFYQEIKDYDFNDPGFTMSTGHFTQMVWCGSTKLGVGIAASDKGFYMVCRYSPPGNMMNAFDTNVFPK